MAKNDDFLSSKDLKKQKVKEYAKWIKKSNAVFLAEPNITANEAVELKKKLADAEAEYHVVKNNLFSRALDKELKDSPEIQGFTGVVFSFSDPVEAAKALYELVNDEKAEVKFGYYDGEKVEEAKIKELSELPGQEEMLGQAVYLIGYPLQGLVTVLQAPMRDLVQVLAAVKGKE